MVAASPLAAVALLRRDHKATRSVRHSDHRESTCDACKGSCQRSPQILGRSDWEAAAAVARNRGLHASTFMKAPRETHHEQPRGAVYLFHLVMTVRLGLMRLFRWGISHIPDRQPGSAFQSRLTSATGEVARMHYPERSDLKGPTVRSLVLTVGETAGTLQWRLERLRPRRRWRVAGGTDLTIRSRACQRKVQLPPAGFRRLSNLETAAAFSCRH